LLTVIYTSYTITYSTRNSAITDKLCNAVVQYATVWLNPS